MPDLKVLVVGGGGREHALAWMLARSPQVSHVYVAPGNAGTIWAANPSAVGLQPCAASTNVPIPAHDIAALAAFAHQQNIDLTVIGPEAPLAAGIVDTFISAGLRVFGPTQAAAQLESSKTFAKDFMREHGIPTAEYASFDDYPAACHFVRGFGKPVVVKADGLAAGKGVFICDTPDEAISALHILMIQAEFGASGSRVVIEERLTGLEVSALALSDGQSVAMLPLARDHKRVFDDDRGPNTGGMGAYAPVPDVDASTQEYIRQSVLQPAVSAMAARGTPFVGVLFAGLILSPDGPQVLEFNCRLGDPETQCILPLLNGDLVEILLACTEQCLHRGSFNIRSGTCATVVLASPGYPGTYPSGLPISSLDTQSDQVMVFHAGTALKDGQIVTSGGRVLSVSGWDATLPAALERAYAHIEHLHFDGMHYRQDIGRLHQPQGTGN